MLARVTCPTDGGSNGTKTGLYNMKRDTINKQWCMVAVISVCVCGGEGGACVCVYVGGYRRMRIN